MKITSLAIAGLVLFGAASVDAQPGFAADQQKGKACKHERYFPLAAEKAKVSGRVVLTCIVTTSGLAKACKVVSEDPPGFGFGDAALTLSDCFHFKPKTVDGVPSEGETTFPINFKLPS